jgi:hypothetical protein
MEIRSRGPPVSRLDNARFSPWFARKTILFWIDLRMSVAVDPLRHDLPLHQPQPTLSRIDCWIHDGIASRFVQLEGCADLLFKCSSWFPLYAMLALVFLV